MRAGTLTASYVLDWLVGDPEFLPHPVRIIGRAIEIGARALCDPEATDHVQFVRGAVLTMALVAGSACAASKAVRLLKDINSQAGKVAEMWLGASCLATRNLLDEAGAVITTVEQNDLETARRLLSRIVGRDTDTLDASEISRAVIETVAESLCDGIIAPLMYLMIGGVPLALAYKAVNTLDSMIGHHTEQYEWFGKAAARLDDAANFAPARMAAVLICGSCALLGVGNHRTAWSTWRQDRLRNASPNAGQTESAMAGALCVRLGGTNSYCGEIVEGPVLGAEFPPPTVQDAKNALRITAVASVLGFALSILFLSRRRSA